MGDRGDISVRGDMGVRGDRGDKGDMGDRDEIVTGGDMVIWVKGLRG